MNSLVRDEAYYTRQRAEEWYIEASRPFLRQLADLYTVFGQPAFLVGPEGVKALPITLHESARPLEAALKRQLEMLSEEAARRATEHSSASFLARVSE